MRDPRKILVAIAVFGCLLGNTGCASFGRTLKGWVSGKEPVDPSKAQVTTPRFSEQENLRVPADRQYRRMTKQKFEEEADVKEDAGSLWVMEGQGAYLFAQNQMRMVGDLLNVKVEGAPKTQLQTKVRVISKLLEKLENPVVRAPASQAGVNGAPQNGNPGNPAPGTQGANEKGDKGQAANGETPAGAANADGTNGAAGANAAAAKGDGGPFNVQTVPTRIVEQLKDGSYRVRGMQPFMIGKREYKVIVTGIVRGEDFDDAGIDASKLLDPQFDIVSSRKGASL